MRSWCRASRRRSPTPRSCAPPAWKPTSPCCSIGRRAADRAAAAARRRSSSWRDRKTSPGSRACSTNDGARWRAARGRSTRPSQRGGTRGGGRDGLPRVRHRRAARRRRVRRLRVAARLSRGAMSRAARIAFCCCSTGVCHHHHLRIARDRSGGDCRSAGGGSGGRPGDVDGLDRRPALEDRRRWIRSRRPTGRERGDQG